jgi:hypothetical protein
MTTPSSPGLPPGGPNSANQIWSCPEESCDYRVWGLEKRPLADGVCKSHPRRRLVKEDRRGQGR